MLWHGSLSHEIFEHNFRIYRKKVGLLGDYSWMIFNKSLGKGWLLNMKKNYHTLCIWKLWERDGWAFENTRFLKQFTWRFFYEDSSFKSELKLTLEDLNHFLEKSLSFEVPWAFKFHSFLLTRPPPAKYRLISLFHVIWSNGRKFLNHQILITLNIKRTCTKCNLFTFFFLMLFRSIKIKIRN